MGYRDPVLNHHHQQQTNNQKKLGKSEGEGKREDKRVGSDCGFHYHLEVEAARKVFRFSGFCIGALRLRGMTRDGKGLGSPPILFQDWPFSKGVGARSLSCSRTGPSVKGQ